MDTFRSSLAAKIEAKELEYEKLLTELNLLRELLLEYDFNNADQAFLESTGDYRRRKEGESWRDYTLYVIRKFGKEFRSPEIVKVIMKANGFPPNLRESVRRNLVRSILELIEKGIIEISAKGESNRSGNEYILTEQIKNPE